MMDLLPTLLHAADGAAPALADVDGISLLDVLRDPGAEVPERAVAWAYDGQLAVRRGRFKLVRDAREGMDPPAVVAQALYDLEADPGELVDVSAERPELVLALSEELAGFRETPPG
jgi:arylsulfatase A-like enzyme